MNDSEKETICFLFGAGAEVSYGMPMGPEFAKYLFEQKVNDALKLIYNEVIESSPLVHPNSKKIFSHTILENVELFNKLSVEDFSDYFKKSEISTLENVIELAEKYEKNGAQDVDNYNKWKEFLKELKIKINEYVNSQSKDINQNYNVVEFFIKNLKICETLDEKFNGLRFSDEKNVFYKKAQKVINAYCNIHFRMFQNVFPEFKFKNNKHCGEEFLKALRSTISDYHQKIATSIVNKDSTPKHYYEIIYKFKEEYKDKLDFCFATTNYTEFSSNVFGIENVAYLNGRMTWFENHKTLCIYDLSKDNINELLDCKNRIKKEIFPFIFLQSGVKPVVAPIQIEHYHKFISALNKANKLLVIGYNLNNDDNHINAIIADWLRQDNKKMICLQYHDSKTQIVGKNSDIPSLLANESKIDNTNYILTDLMDKNIDTIKRAILNK